MTICPECENLLRAFESKQSEYRAARSAVLYRISTEFAAKQQVDMERARYDKEEHVLICPLVATVAAPDPGSATVLPTSGRFPDIVTTLALPILLAAAVPEVSHSAQYSERK